jgi:hypothetical protein
LLQDDANSTGNAEVTRRLRLMIEKQSMHLPSQTAFSNLMTRLAGNGLDLLNHETRDTRFKIAGLSVLDCLLDVNDEIMPERRIEIVNHLRKVFENDKSAIESNIVVIRTAALSIGHFARIASPQEIEFLQNFYLPFAFKLVGNSRSDCQRFAGALILTQLSLNSPSLIFARRKLLFSAIWEVVSDKNSIVREAAAEVLQSAFHLVSQREPITEYLVIALTQIESGFTANTSEKVIGSLLIIDMIIGGNVLSNLELQNMIRDQNLEAQEIIWKVLQRKDSRDIDVKHKVIDIIPNLASAFSTTFSQKNIYTNGSTFLGFTVRFLLETIKGKRDRQISYISLGKLFISSAVLRTSPVVKEVFGVINDGFKVPFCVEAMQSLGMIVNASLSSRQYVTTDLVDAMFLGGLTPDLIENLKILMKHVPLIRSHLQSNLRMHITATLLRYNVLVDEGTVTGMGGTTSATGVDNRSSIKNGTKQQNTSQTTNNGSNSNTSSSQPIKDSGKGLKSSISSVFGSPGKVVSNKPSRFYGPSGLFGNNNNNNFDGFRTTTQGNTEGQLILALRVLACHDFFPKQTRDRGMLKDSFTEGDEDQSLNLLRVLRAAVVRYLDAFNPELRGEAAVTCLAVLDATVLSVDQSAEEYSYCFQILDRLLMLGVGDDSAEIRVRIFSAFTPTLDHVVVQSANVHCLLESLNDESLEVRAASMSVLARAAHYDALHIMPVVRLMMKRLMRLLQNTADSTLRMESVHLLQALVKGSHTLIVPYVSQVLGSLMKLLNDPSSTVVGAALSTIGELALASPESVSEHLDVLLPRLIDALNDGTSVSKQEMAVVAMGKLVSSLTMVTEEPYSKYPGLFEGLVKAIQNSDEASMELRLQAIRTAGLLGAVDEKGYHEYLRRNGGVVDAFSSQVC